MNYNEIMKNQIDELNGRKPKLLLHVCCAPCASVAIEKLVPYFDITLFYFNPNIAPETEYIKRGNELKKLVEYFKVNLIEVPYDNKLYLSLVEGLENEKEGGKRCTMCIDFRLKTTFNYAIKHNFEYVTTSLTTGTNKDSTLINEIGAKFETMSGTVTWLFSDFKKDDGFQRSIELSNKLKLYRQNYCGCDPKKHEN